jgi:hypothetical protein
MGMVSIIVDLYSVIHLKKKIKFYVIKKNCTFLIFLIGASSLNEFEERIWAF